MSRLRLSDTSIELLKALNRRGVRGPVALTLLRRQAHRQIAPQIDYYGYEIARVARRPDWGAGHG